MPTDRTTVASGPARTIVLVAIGMLGLAAALIALPSIWSPAGVFGWNIGPDGVTVMSVTRGYPAASAGIVPNDRIVYPSLSLRARFDTVLVTPVRPGQRISFLLQHGGVRREVTLTAAQWPVPLTATSSTAALLINLISIGVGIALVALRGNVMTWAFLLYGATALVPFSEDPFVLASDAAMATVLSATTLVGGLSGAAAFVFIGRFPSGAVRPWTPALDWIAAAWFAAVATSGAYVMWTLIRSPDPPAHWLLFTQQYGLPTFGAIVILAALVANYAAARGLMRARILPVLAAFALSTFFTLLAVLVNDVTTDAPAVYGATLASQLFQIAFPLTVAYAVIRHRVMDINFVVSRTLVYTVLTGGILAAFALLHYLVGKQLERTQLALALELLLAIAYGVWLQAIHDRLDGWIGGVLFRKRHIAELRLQRIADAVVNVETAEVVDDMLVAEAAEALGLASAAVFRANESSSYVRRIATGWSDTDARSLDGLDRLVVELRSLLGPLELTAGPLLRGDFPQGFAAPLLAIAIVVDHRLAAFALYGGHIHGEAIDPDERRLLETLARGAATAYDHIAEAALVRRISELETENAGLRQAQQLLVDAAQMLRTDAAALREFVAHREPEPPPAFP